MLISPDEGLALESMTILETLRDRMPKQIEGREAILELKEANYQWRQMEWIGWYVEYKTRTILTEVIGGQPSPTFGLTRLDYSRNYMWDFKAHPWIAFDGRLNDSMILNDKEAIDRCIENNGGVGFVIAVGDATFDTSGEFKQWHDRLKGVRSRYETERVERGAPSRIRKTSFKLRNLKILFFNSATVIEEGLSQGWLRMFQQGMRNANGSPRRAKYMIRTSAIPDSIRPVSPLVID